jgi:hypothetical protein
MNESSSSIDGNLTASLTNNVTESTADNNVITIDGKVFSVACINYLTSILSPDELPAAIIHCQTSSENDAQDSWGQQGGQFWQETSSPTAKPTNRPTTNSPTTTSPTRVQTTSLPSFSPSISYHPTGSSPTYHPTLHDKLFVLRGTIYYDRNANGNRDSNIETSEYGADTEYNIGLGGVNLKLVECDLSTNDAVKNQVNGQGQGGGGWNSYSTTISQGYDVLFKPGLADRGVDGGK